MEIEKMDYDRTGKILTEDIDVKPTGQGILEDKVAIITGATLGIGLACAVRFVRERAKVVITGIEEEIGRTNAQFLTNQGGECSYYNVNAFHRDEVKAMVADVMKKYGRVDILVNCAGYNIPVHFEQAKPDEFRQMVGIHGLAHAYTLWEILPIMETQGGGAVLEFGSKSSDKPAAHDPFYGFAKAGVKQMSKVLTMEVAQKNIRINCICPGATVTGMTTLKNGEIIPDFKEVAKTISVGRYAYPEDIAKAAVWICSDEAGYVSGLTFNVDGGIVT
jgi:3-oxoacyl-[acyl-carrier protein] reductase